MAADSTPSRLRAPSATGLWREGLIGFEPALLALHSVRLARQPRGDGRRVVTLPGFGASDASTAPLRAYLSRLGYRPEGWGLGRNGGDVEAFVRSMIVRIERTEPERPVPLIGWSLGGVIAREIARERPDLVEQVITFGSPVVGGPKYTRVGATYAARGADLDEIEAMVAERNRTPIRVPVTAIYTRTDGVVAWRACIDTVNPGTEHVEVRSTHLGMGIHHEVYVTIAQRLARRSMRRV